MHTLQAILHISSSDELKKAVAKELSCDSKDKSIAELLDKSKEEDEEEK